MHEFPHLYQVLASSEMDGVVRVAAAQLPTLETGAPPEFGGREGLWSPETLLSAAVADCFILSFRAIARASKLAWEKLECRVEGRLDRVDGVTRFTHFDIHAELSLAEAERRAIAERCLQKAEKSCLITNSLLSDTELHFQIVLADKA